MWNKKFKQETQFLIYTEDWKAYDIVKDKRTIKKRIYSSELRNQKYTVREITEEGEVINEWIYKYLNNGIIFQRKIYSKWEKMKEEAKKLETHLEF